MSCLNDNCSTGMDLETKNALQQTQCIIQQRGSKITLRLDDEQTVERDDFGSIKKRTAETKTVYAFPIDFSPTQKSKDRNGIRENVQVMCTTPMQDWIDLGFSDKDLSNIDSIRATIILRGQTYEIKDKSLKDQFGDTYLYIVLGLNRK